MGYRRVELDEASRRVTLRDGARLDLGAVAKGHAVDLAVGALRAHGATAGLVDLGRSSVPVFGQPLTLDLADIPSAQRLNAALGLSLRPLDPARSRSGLFVLASRPVEFTANPIASYPTSITGPRSVEDGEIIEATAATLIPFPDEGDASEWNRRRSRVAHQVFVERATRGLPAGVLPLAMVGRMIAAGCASRPDVGCDLPALRSAKTLKGSVHFSSNVWQA